MKEKSVKEPEKKTPLVHSRIKKEPVNILSIEAMTAESDKMVPGTFVNIECPGQPAKISAKLYKGQELFCKTFEDGEKCTIPYSVARFINERCLYEKHKYELNDQGEPLKIIQRLPRYKFTAEFAA